MKFAARSFPLFVTLNVLWCIAVGSGHWPELNKPVWLVAPAGALICVYFWILFTQRRLSSRQIDSVYYLGFLTTLAVLGISAYSLSQGSGRDGDGLQAGGAQFALGLLATGLGLFFRLSLQSRAATPGSTAQLLDQYAETIGRLSDRMDEAARKFERLADETIQSASDTSRKTATAALENVTGALEPAVKELRNAVTGINRSLTRIDPAQMRTLTDAIDGLGRSMSQLSGALPPVTDSIKQFQSELDKNTQSHSKHSAVSETAAAALAAITERLVETKTGLASLHHAFGEHETQLSRTTQAQGNYAQSSEKVAGSLEVAATVLNRVTANMSETGKNIAQIVESLDAAGLQSLSATLKDSVDRMKVMNKEMDVLATAVNTAHGSIGKQMGNLHGNFDVQIKEMNDASSALGNAMVNLASSIKRSVEDALRY